MDLTKATKIAIQEMIDFLVATKGLDKHSAYQLASIAADVAITQLVDGNVGRSRQDTEEHFYIRKIACSVRLPPAQGGHGSDAFQTIRHYFDTFHLRCCVIAPAAQQASRAGGIDSIQQEPLKEWLTYIASDELQGRATYSEGLGLAAGYISSHLAAVGRQAGGRPRHVPPGRQASSACARRAAPP